MVFYVILIDKSRIWDKSYIQPKGPKLDSIYFQVYNNGIMSHTVNDLLFGVFVVFWPLFT